jgi:hypothetical protein
LTGADRRLIEGGDALLTPRPMVARGHVRASAGLLAVVVEEEGILF